MPLVVVDGIELAWERAGGGPPLLLLHGSGSTMAEMVLLRAPFEARFDVLTFDYRGMGRSGLAVMRYSMADLAADALALADLAGWDRFRLVGVSFGGMVAQEVAVAAPERIERLALLCTSPGGAGGASYPLHDGPPPPTVVDRRWTPEWLEEHPADRGLLDLMGRRLEGKSRAVVHGEGLQLDARRGHDAWDRLHRVACPTLVAAGRHDGLAPPENAEALAGAIDGAELRWYEGGHVFPVQDPTAIPEVADFLAG